MTAEKNLSANAGEPIERRRKLPVRTKLLFASGTLQEATVNAAGIVTLLFYNQVLGVSPSLVGIAVLQTRRDAVFEPMVVTEREPAAGLI